MRRRTFVFLVALAAMVEPALAQVEEIIVSARKTQENIQDVPVAVTALSETKLDQTSTYGPIDLQFLVPNMSAREGTGSSTAAVFSIRGQVQVDYIGTLDPSVGFYDDGIYVARPHGSNLSFVDVRSIEVLRGPQGTLFGRNTTGGAILMTSNDPDFEAISGTLDAVLGSFKRRDLTAVLNVPVWQDKLAIRFAGKTRQTDGYGFDETNDRDIATEDNEFFRVKVLFQPLDDLRFLLNGEYLDMDQLGNPIKPQFALKLTDAQNPVPGLPPCCLAATAIPNYDDFVGGDPYTAHYDPGLRPRSKMRLDSLSLTSTWDTEWTTVKLIGGIRRNHDVSNRLDLEGTPTLFVNTTQFGDNEQWSAELQFTGTWLDGRLKWALGGYGFDENGHDNGTTDAFAPGIQILTRGHVENSSQGGYAQATYYLLEKLGVTGGLRYSADQKDLTLSASISDLVCQIPQDMRDDPTNPLGPCVGTFAKNFDNLSYTAGADYHLLEDTWSFDSLLVYASRTTGYRSGGQNLRGASAETLAPFDEETVVQHEIGVKSDLLERRVRLNLAGFYTDYDDIQRDAIIAVNGLPATVISNAAKATIKGVELELTALPPVDGLELGASFGWVDPEYDEFVDASGQDRSEEKFDDVPEMTYSLSAAYMRDFFDVPWLGRVDWAWQDDTFFTRGTGNYFAMQGVDIEPLTTMPSGGVLNIRTAITLGERLEIAFVGRNLTDRTRFAFIPVGQGPDFVSKFVNAPGREFAGELRFTF